MPNQINIDALLEEHFHDDDMFLPNILCFPNAENREMKMQKNLEKVDYLLSLNDKNVYRELWNSVNYRNRVDLDYVKKQGTKQTYNFYKKTIGSHQKSSRKL